MLGESVVKLAQAIGKMAEAVRASIESHTALLEGASYGDAGETALLVDMTGIVYTAAMALVMYLTFKHSVKLSRKQDTNRLRDKITDELSSIAMAISSKSSILNLDRYHQKTAEDISSEYGYIYSTINRMFLASSKLPITIMYISNLVLTLLGHVLDSEGVSKDAGGKFIEFEDKIVGICLQLVKLSDEHFKIRLNCEEESYNYYRVQSKKEKELDVEAKDVVLNKAMINLGRFKPYMFSQTVVPPSSQSKK